MTDDDIAKLEMVEETLERIVAELETTALKAELHAIGITPEQYREIPIPVSRPKATALTVAQCKELIEQLNEVLDHVQIVLGRPYVWLLARM